jgi:hypothetical protein
LEGLHLDTIQSSDTDVNGMSSPGHGLPPSQPLWKPWDVPQSSANGMLE